MKNTWIDVNRRATRVSISGRLKLKPKNVCIIKCSRPQVAVQSEVDYMSASRPQTVNFSKNNSTVLTSSRWHFVRS